MVDTHFIPTFIKKKKKNYSVYLSLRARKKRKKENIEDFFVCEFENLFIRLSLFK